MRILKVTIFAAVVITILILLGIGYVWRELAFTSQVIVPANSIENTATTSFGETAFSTTSTVTSTPIVEPIMVTTSDLPDAQQSVLKTLGLEDASITITPQMVACAIDSLGSARAAEIQKGDTPSLAEGLTLIACMKK